MNSPRDVSFLADVFGRHLKVFARVEPSGEITSLSAEDVDSYEHFERLELLDREGGRAIVEQFEAQATIEAAKPRNVAAETSSFLGRIRAGGR